MLNLFNLERSGNRFAFRYPHLFFCGLFFLIPIICLLILGLAILLISWPLCILLEKIALAGLV